MAIYYVDFVSGNDGNTGLSTAAPWKTIPGTRLDTTLPGGSPVYKTTNYGAGTFIAGSVRVPDGTIFKIKSGTTHSQTNGYAIYITAGSGNYYSTGYTTGVTFETDLTWGTGAKAIIDGASMGNTDSNTIGLFFIQVDKIIVNNISMKNNGNSGIYFKEKAGGGALTGGTVSNCDFFNIGTQYLDDVSASSSGAIVVRQMTGLSISNVTIDGDSNFINGIVCGDNGKAVTGTITSCSAINCVGDLVNNDAGIGFKALNCQIDFTSCISHDNNKGFDAGEQSGTGDINVKFINCESYNNGWGINYNSAAGTYAAGTVKFYLINCLIYNNAYAGVNGYAGPHDAFIVHCVFDNNGASDGVPEGVNMITTPNHTTDNGLIRVYIRNSIFKRGIGGNFLNKYFTMGTNNFSIDSDYNSYQQYLATDFFTWSYYDGPQSSVYGYGANGPGHASGNFYSRYGASTTPPTNGTGHFHCDSHSKGTGCTDTTLPSFNGDYTLTGSYDGVNISGETWYISAMGLDKNGNTRTGTPDMGAFEFGGGGGSSSSVIISGGVSASGGVSLA